MKKVLGILFLLTTVISDSTAVELGATYHLFSQLKKLKGTWQGHSSKGWENTTNYRVIARGSVVMATSEFKDEPGEGMASLFHMDSDRLLLTHYCEAGNVPVLQASSIEDDGRKITFEFIRGSNLPSRNKGHMHKVILHLLDDNHFTAQWTWYQDGKERWLEKIDYKRLQ
ncbi:hypothetical protein L0244_02590 [bacterium]|nr:hypothetical protein [bacterium]MCI0611855.1 hypothetical protein [bacterium]